MKYGKKIAVVALLAIGMAGPQAPVWAQGVFDMGMLTNTLAQGAIVKSEKERASRMHGGKGSSSPRPKTRPPVRATPFLGTFKQSTSVRKQNVAKLIAKMRVADPQNAASLQKALETQDGFGVIGREMAKYGLKTNNIADPMAAYLAIAWQGVHGKNSDPTKAQLLGVRNQMARALGGVPAVKRLTDAQKQEMADSFIVQTMLVVSSVGAAQKQPALRAQVKAAIAASARANFGFDLAALKLTSRGLEA